MELLKQLYLTHSPSHHEDEMADLVRKELNRIGVKHATDDDGQIYALGKKAPLLCAHMDQVQSQACTNVVYNRGNLYGTDPKGYVRGLGADDKNGIWICLKLIEKYPHVNFIFSTCEEAGGNIQNLLNKLAPVNFERINFGLVFDRKGAHDIIGIHNGYCEVDLNNDLESLDMGFEAAQGTFSDCDHLSEHIPCVNISCGYHGAHTTSEYTVPTELLHSLEFGKTILRTMWKESYQKPMVSIFDRDPRPIFVKQYTGKFINEYKGKDWSPKTTTSTEKETIEAWDEDDYYLCSACFAEYSKEESERFRKKCIYCSGMIIKEEA